MSLLSRKWTSMENQGARRVRNGSGTLDSKWARGTVRVTRSLRTAPAPLPTLLQGQQGRQNHRALEVDVHRAASEVRRPVDQELAAPLHLYDPAFAERREVVSQTGDNAAVSTTLRAGPDGAGEELQQAQGVPPAQVLGDRARVRRHRPDRVQQAGIVVALGDHLPQTREDDLDAVADLQLQPVVVDDADVERGIDVGVRTDRDLAGLDRFALVDGKLVAARGEAVDRLEAEHDLAPRRRVPPRREQFRSELRTDINRHTHSSQSPAKASKRYAREARGAGSVVPRCRVVAAATGVNGQDAYFVFLPVLSGRRCRPTTTFRRFVTPRALVMSAAHIYLRSALQCVRAAS